MDKETIINHLNNTINGDYNSINAIIEEYLTTNYDSNNISAIYEVIRQQPELSLNLFSSAARNLITKHEINTLMDQNSKTIKYL